MWQMFGSTGSKYAWCGYFCWIWYKEAEYQKLLEISKDILKEKRATQRQLEQVKAQNKESDKDVEFARLQKHSQVLSDLATLAEASRSL